MLSRRSLPPGLGVAAAVSPLATSAFGQGHCRDGYGTRGCPLTEDVATKPIKPLLHPRDGRPWRSTASRSPYPAPSPWPGLARLGRPPYFSRPSFPLVARRPIRTLHSVVPRRAQQSSGNVLSVSTLFRWPWRARGTPREQANWARIPIPSAHLPQLPPPPRVVRWPAAPSYPFPAARRRVRG